MSKYVIGIDFGTLSGRALLMDAQTGCEIAEATMEYKHAVMDTALPSGKKLPPNYALQHPADYDKWAQICEHIILHYNEGWADGFNYDIEYWEVYNEPDCQPVPENSNFWQGTPEEFYRLYDVTAQYLKSKFPDLKIGGYGSCGFYALTKTNAVNTGSSPENQYFITFFEDFLAYAKEHNSPMDFFTWQAVPSHTLITYFPLASKEKFS